MNLDISLLKKICETAGAPGHEKQIRDLIVQAIKPYTRKTKQELSKKWRQSRINPRK